MTFVQILIFIVSMAVYGIAPIGFDEIIVSQEIIQPNLALKLESYREKANLWIGPRQVFASNLFVSFMFSLHSLIKREKFQSSDNWVFLIPLLVALYSSSLH